VFARLRGSRGDGRRPSDRVGLLHQLRHRKDERLLEPRRHDLKADGEPVGGLAGGDAAGRKADEGDEEGGRDPVDIVLEGAPIDFGGKFNSTG
jgi:hypothetical protein